VWALPYVRFLGERHVSVMGTQNMMLFNHEWFLGLLCFCNISTHFIFFFVVCGLNSCLTLARQALYHLSLCTRKLFAFSLRGLTLSECTSWQLRKLVKYNGKTRHIWFCLLEHRFLLPWGFFWVYGIGEIATASLLSNNCWAHLLVCSFFSFYLFVYFFAFLQNWGLN
jgi:hypothetical protein